MLDAGALQDAGAGARVESRAFRRGPADLQLPRLLAQGAAHAPVVRAEVVAAVPGLEVVGLTQSAIKGSERRLGRQTSRSSSWDSWGSETLVRGLDRRAGLCGLGLGVLLLLSHLKDVLGSPKQQVLGVLELVLKIVALALVVHPVRVLLLLAGLLVKNARQEYEWSVVQQDLSTLLDAKEDSRCIRLEDAIENATSHVFPPSLSLTTRNSLSVFIEDSQELVHSKKNGDGYVDSQEMSSLHSAHWGVALLSRSRF